MARAYVNHVNQPACLFRLEQLRVCKPALRLFNFLTAQMFLVEVSSSFITVSGVRVLLISVFGRNVFGG